MTKLKLDDDVSVQNSNDQSAKSPGKLQKKKSLSRKVSRILEAPVELDQSSKKTYLPKDYDNCLAKLMVHLISTQHYLCN